MDPSTIRALNKAISRDLNALGKATANNMVKLERAFGSEPLKWMPQLGADIELAYKEMDRLMTNNSEDGEPPDMGQITKALEGIVVAGFCLQMVTRHLSPKIAVVTN